MNWQPIADYRHEDEIDQVLGYWYTHPIYSEPDYDVTYYMDKGWWLGEEIVPPPDFFAELVPPGGEK